MKYSVNKNVCKLLPRRRKAIYNRLRKLYYHFTNWTNEETLYTLINESEFLQIAPKFSEYIEVKFSNNFYFCPLNVSKI